MSSQTIPSVRTLSISIVIPVYNGGHAFDDCIRSLKAMDPQPSEIIVVDDGSTDNSPQKARDAGFRVLHTMGRCGPARARNLGAEQAIGDLIYFVDADCSVACDAIEHILPVFEAEPQVHAMIGSYDDTPSAKNLLSQYKNLLHHYTHHTSGPQGFTFWGACGVIRREVFRSLGGFDTAYTKASIEDIELGYRIKAAGGQIRVNPELQVKHHKQWRPVNLFHTDVFLRAVPWSRLILKSEKMENSLNTSVIARLRVALSGGIAACCLVSVLIPNAFLLAALLAVLLLICDWPVLSWFSRKRGFAFALAILPWHWFSHFYSGCSFLAVLILHRFQATVAQESQGLSPGVPEYSSPTA